MQKLKSIKTEIELIYNSWCRRTTYQTLPRFAASTNKNSKRFWLTATTFLSSLCYYFVMNRINTLNLTETTLNRVVIKEMSFPAVTICDLGYLKLSTDPFKDEEASINDTIHDYFTENFEKEKGMKEMFENFASHQALNRSNKIEDILLSCQINSFKCNASQFLKIDEACWTFDSKILITTPGVKYGLQIEILRSENLVIGLSKSSSSKLITKYLILFIYFFKKLKKYFVILKRIQDFRT